jgi:deoxycytidylate deaminase
LGVIKLKATIPAFKLPELIFGFVAPIGADISEVLNAYKMSLENFGYIVEEVKVTDAYKHFRETIPPNPTLTHKRNKDRYDTHIKYGNLLRSQFGDDILAKSAIVRLLRKRLRKRDRQPERYQGVAYLVHQFKRKEEIDLFRSVYADLFFQVSVYSRRGARVSHLEKVFSQAANTTTYTTGRADAEQLIAIDEAEHLVRQEDELSRKHGQQVTEIFHDADFIVNIDITRPNPKEQVQRFCDLLFGANFHSPSHLEYGMFLAKAAALRTIDLSRQVGAALFGPSGEVITLGSNEVPKAGGGTYWSDDEKYDDRDFVRGVDSNDERKRQVLREILDIAVKDGTAETLMADDRVRKSQVMDALEYGRIVHAEMSAISDAARLGRPLKDAVLYCTTFPCHMCAKHIVAAGIKKVHFLEPYPKSLASQLHSDSICVEHGDRGRYNDYPAVEFEHFYGITPRKYKSLFARGKRKDSEGRFVRFKNQESPIPNMDIKSPFYSIIEKVVINSVQEISLKAFDEMQAEDD